MPLWKKFLVPVNFLNVLKIFQLSNNTKLFFPENALPKKTKPRTPQRKITRVEPDLQRKRILFKEEKYNNLKNAFVEKKMEKKWINLFLNYFFINLIFFLNFYWL